VRILEVTEASGSGTLEIVRTIAAGTAAAGHTVSLAYGRRPETPDDLAAGLPPAVDLVPLPWRARTPGAQLAAGLALRRLVARWRPDVVHLHSSFAGAVGAVVVARRAPTVYTPHAYAFARDHEGRLAAGAYRAAEWFVARRCTLVGAVSEAEAALSRERLRAPNVVVVPNGIPELDDGAAPPPGPARARPLAVAVGRIGAQRSPEATARILGALRDRADVRWVGGGPAGADAPLRAARVEVTGWLSHEAALAQLAEATLCVHWSAWDGQSLAILEALARDVVVIASDIAPNRELLGPRQTCADEAAAVALARAVLEDGALRAGLLADQRARRARFSASRMVADWLAVYERLAAA
jgi:glycosyltransferase involved in cell wall biosynthesis